MFSFLYSLIFELSFDISFSVVTGTGNVAGGASTVTGGAAGGDLFASIFFVGTSFFVEPIALAAPFDFVVLLTFFNFPLAMSTGGGAVIRFDFTVGGGCVSLFTGGGP